MGAVVPFGQPIHVGHHSEQADRSYRKRMNSTFDRGLAHHAKAEEMAGKAESITAQLAAAIYDDDPDATGQLRARILILEANRDAMKAANERLNANTHRGAVNLPRGGEEMCLGSNESEDGTRRNEFHPR